MSHKYRNIFSSSLFSFPADKPLDESMCQCENVVLFQNRVAEKLENLEQNNILGQIHHSLHGGVLFKFLLCFKENQTNLNVSLQFPESRECALTAHQPQYKHMKSADFSVFNLLSKIPFDISQLLVGNLLVVVKFSDLFDLFSNELNTNSAKLHKDEV